MEVFKDTMTKKQSPNKFQIPNSKNFVNWLWGIGYCLYLVSWLLVILPNAAAQQPETMPVPDGIYALSLDDVTRLALMNNFDIQLAKYDARIARTGEDRAESIYDLLLKADIGYTNDQRARSSTFAGTKNLENVYSLGLSQKTPFGATLDIDAGDTRTWTNSSFATLNPAHDSELRLTWKQDLGRNLFGIQDRGKIKVSLLNIENSRYTSAEKIEEYLAGVQKMYSNYALALEAVRIEERMVAQAKKLYDLHQEKIKDGLTEEPELFAAEANYHSRLNELLIAGNTAKSKENALKLMLNIDDEAVSLSPTEPFALDKSKQDKNLSLKGAFENRRDYKRAANTLKVRDIELVMDHNNLWPEVNLEISFARNGVGPHLSSAFSDIGGETNPEFSTGVSVEFPLQNREARADVRAGELQKAKSILQMKYLERAITTEIIDHVRSCNILQEAAVNAEKIAALQRRKLEEEEKRFNSGRSDTDTLIRFQEDVIQAELQALRSKLNYYSAVIDLRVAENALLTAYGDEEI